MAPCQHLWKMTDIQFGFIIFERCSQCNTLRTYFSPQDHPGVGDEYREEKHTWRCMENAQSFRFNLKCKQCDKVENFYDLMGFLYCTGCLPECAIEKEQQKSLPRKKFILVAFGHLPHKKSYRLDQSRLDTLSDYFNQRRDTSRSTVSILSYDLIEDFSRCKGEFIHDFGMLSLKPSPKERKPLL